MMSSDYIKMEGDKDGQVLTKKDLRKIFWRSLPMEYSWHYERQMHMGYEFMVIPALRKIYEGQPQKFKEAMVRNLEFFNCTMYVTTFVAGIALSMEEMNAKEDDFDTSAISSLKAALMGPLSGIGDSIFFGTIRILAIGIGTSLAAKGSILGMILFLLIFNIPQLVLRYWGAMKSYSLGTDYLTKIQNSGMMDLFMLAASIVGLMVVGGMTNELVVASTPVTIGTGENVVELQSILDDIMPGMLSFAALGIYYWLLKKKVNVVWLLVGTVVIGIIFSWLGILSA